MLLYELQSNPSYTALSESMVLDASATMVTFVLLSRAPSAARRERTVLQACKEGELLACAFATWLPKLQPDVADVALLGAAMPAGSPRRRTQAGALRVQKKKVARKTRRACPPALRAKNWNGLKRLELCGKT